MSEELRLRVLTFNIHGGRPRVGTADLEATARVIRDLRPDLVGLQEVHRYMPPPYVFQDQPGRLRELLDMTVRFGPAFRLGPMGYGNAILSRAAPEVTRQVALPGGWEPRVLMDARFTLGGRTLHFLNTHLGLTESQRRDQAALIAGRLARYSEPVILVGDWNAPPDSEELRRLQETELVHCGEPEILTFPCDNPECRMDYIMCSRHFEVEDCRVVRTEVSDHLPLVADLRLR